MAKIVIYQKPTCTTCRQVFNALKEKGGEGNPLASTSTRGTYSPQRRVYVDDVLSFSPWYCLPEHRPLGSIMRVRRLVYDASSEFRHQMNALKRIEPTSIDELPD